MRIPIRRLHPDAKLPVYVRGEEDGALDLHTIEGGTIPPGERRVFGTGLAFALPVGSIGFIWGRSGLAFNHGLTMVGGLIDPGYRGEVKVCLLNTDREPYAIQAGDRIGQFFVVQADRIVFDEVAELPSTERNLGGFGSSGK